MKPVRHALAPARAPLREPAEPAGLVLLWALIGPFAAVLALAFEALGWPASRRR